LRKDGGKKQVPNEEEKRREKKEVKKKMTKDVKMKTWEEKHV